MNDSFPMYIRVCQKDFLGSLHFGAIRWKILIDSDIGIGPRPNENPDQNKVMSIFFKGDGH